MSHAAVGLVCVWAITMLHHHRPSVGSTYPTWPGSDMLPRRQLRKFVLQVRQGYIRSVPFEQPINAILTAPAACLAVSGAAWRVRAQLRQANRSR